MFEFNLNNETYTLKPARYFSYIVLKDNEELFKIYPYKKKKDQFILSLFKFNINMNVINIDQPQQIKIEPPEILSAGNLSRSTIDLTVRPTFKKSIKEVFKKF